MNLSTNLPIKSIALLIASAIACLALTGCGNKGPLVKPSAVPATTPAANPAAAPAAAEPAAAEPASEPATAPASEPASGTPAARR